MKNKPKPSGMVDVEISISEETHKMLIELQNMYGYASIDDAAPDIINLYLERLGGTGRLIKSEHGNSNAEINDMISRLIEDGAKHVVEKSKLNSPGHIL